MNETRTIYDLVQTEEQAYKLPITVSENYDWSMYKHIQLTIAYKNSQFYESGNNDDKPYMNIILPILRLQYRAEGFDVKDVELFVNSSEHYYKSFLVRKFHEKWARENNIDTFIDDLVESYVDKGGALVKNVNGPCPEVVPLETIAFCDQTDILSGPIAIKHNYSPDQLLEMEKKGWGKFGTSIQDLLSKATREKESIDQSGRENSTPGKYIEVYEVHGMFPKSWLKDGSTKDGKDDYVRQMHIITFEKNADGTKNGVCLFKGEVDEIPFKIVLRDKIYGRGLGLGGAEELFESQVWTNYDNIIMKGMLDAASKVIYKTTDSTIAAKHPTGLKDTDNGEIIEVAPQSDISQLDTSPRSINIFENNRARWEEHARIIGAAGESIMGEQPASGTPFKLQELVNQEAHSLHEYRKGKLATFLDEIYRDWVIPYIVSEITKGTEFLSALDLHELQAVAESVVVCQVNDMIKEKILNGELIPEEEIANFKEKSREQFMKGGNKKFIKILKGEFKDTPIDVFTNIVGKQKNMTAYTDKLVNIFRQIVATPQVLDDPRMAKLFNEILESSGLSPIDFYQKPKEQPVQPAPNKPQLSPMQPQQLPLTAQAQ